MTSFNLSYIPEGPWGLKLEHMNWESGVGGNDTA